MIENTEKKERVLLVAVAGNTAANDINTVQESLAELGELVKTAGAETVGQVIQNREAVHAGTYIGKGKIDEVAELLRETGADGILTDDELSPAQMKNLEDALGCKVMDRTMLILDIFAKHASTKEGTIQVELAQLKYRATRLIGAGTAMSRLGGGIGTRGPGEKKLEVDRRLIRDRISQLNRELKEVQQNRETQRARRERSAVPVVAIVGYTNAGKSTLLNRLTGAGVLSEDKLFATLDPTTRAYRTADGQEILFTDTVGFIRKLPHHLVDAFRSTLEEAALADVLVIVSDGSSPDMLQQHDTVEEVLAELGATEQKRIEVINKCDAGDPDPVFPGAVLISAKTGEGLDDLLDKIAETLQASHRPVTFVVPFSRYGILAEIRPLGRVLSEEHTETGTEVTMYIAQDDAERVIRKYGNDILKQE